MIYFNEVDSSFTGFTFLEGEKSSASCTFDLSYCD